jgi:hypothetical protein
MSILTELAKRAAMKTAARVAPEIKVATSAGQVVPATSPLARVAAEAPQGLESPSRRKILKQAVASAARASVPDVVAAPLMKMATSPLEEGMARALKEANIETFNPVSVNQLIRDLINQGTSADELGEIGSLKAYPLVTQHYLEHFYPQDQLQYLGSGLKKLHSLGEAPVIYRTPALSTDQSERIESIKRILRHDPGSTFHQRELKELMSLPPEHNYTASEINRLKRLAHKHDPEFKAWLDSMPPGQSGYYGERLSAEHVDPFTHLRSGEADYALSRDPEVLSEMFDPEVAEAMAKRLEDLNISAEEEQALRHLGKYLPQPLDEMDSVVKKSLLKKAPTDSEDSFIQWLDEMGGLREDY